MDERINLQKLSVMISYSHRDKVLKEDLERVLSTLMRQDLIDLWSDRCIKVGAEIDSSIDDAMNEADIIILLVSADFISSNYCYKKELQVALSRHQDGSAVVVPIIVRPCEWEVLPFGKLRALPEDGKPVSIWADKDNAWLDVAKGLRTVVEGQRERNLRRPYPEIRGMRDHLKDAFTRMHDRYTSMGAFPENVFVTGLKQLDAALDGIQQGDVIVFAGRPKAGYNEIALSSALNASISKSASVLYVSPRESSLQVVRRSLSWLSRIPVADIVSTHLSEDDWRRLTSAITLLSESKFLIDDSRVFGAKAAVERIYGLVGQVKPTFLVVEGLDYFIESGVHSHASGETFLSTSLRKLALEFNIPVFCSLAIAPGPERRADKRPMLSDLGGWHCLEEDADQLIFMYREDVYYPDSADAGQVEFIIVRNRRRLTIETIRAHSTLYGHFVGIEKD